MYVLCREFKEGIISFSFWKISQNLEVSEAHEYLTGRSITLGYRENFKSSLYYK